MSSVTSRAPTSHGARAAEHLRSGRRERELFEVIGWRATRGRSWTDPVDEAISRCEEFRELVRSSPIATASTLNPLAVLHAMKGEFETAEQLLQQAGEMLHELGGLGSGVSHLETWVRLLADRPALAEARLRADMDTLSSMSAGAALATTTALLAQAVYAQGRMREAGDLCQMTQRRAAAEDTMTQVIWRGVQAKVLAHEGRCDEAESLAREAVALAEPTDLLSHRGDAMLDLAEVLRTCERNRRVGSRDLDRPSALRAQGQRGRGGPSAVAAQSIEQEASDAGQAEFHRR